MLKDKIAKLMLIAVVAAVIVFRIYLIIFTSQFGPDESIFALRAIQFLRCEFALEKMMANTPHEPIVKELLPHCKILPTYGMPGHLGIPYGPLPNYLLIFLYWIFDFNFVMILLVISVVSISAPFLLYFSLNYTSERLIKNRDDNKKWVLLLALTSPLSIIFSLRSFWDTPWLIPLSSLIIFLSQKENLFWFKELIIGLLLGIAFASHIQVIPFILGFIIWHLILFKPNITRSILLLSGILMSSGYYILNLLLDGKIFSFHPKIRGQENMYPNIVSLLTGYFKFFGVHSHEIINSANPILNIEISLSKITTGLLLFFIFLLVIFLKRYIHRLDELHPLIFLAGILLLIYLPIYWFTNAAAQPQYGMMLWWIAPVLIPYLVFGVFSKRLGTTIMSLLVMFNLVSIVVQYKDRIIYQTNLGSALGHSWLDQRRIARQICKSVNTFRLEKSTRVVIGVAPSIPNGSALTLSLPTLIAMENPDCTKKVLFREGSDADLVVVPHPNNYNLQLNRQKRP